MPHFSRPGGSDFMFPMHGLAFAIGVFPRNSPKSVFSLGNTDRGKMWKTAKVEIYQPAAFSHFRGASRARGERLDGRTLDHSLDLDCACTETRAQTLKALHPGSSEDAKRRRETPSTACPAEKLYAETP